MTGRLGLAEFQKLAPDVPAEFVRTAYSAVYCDNGVTTPKGTKAVGFREVTPEDWYLSSHSGMLSKGIAIPYPRIIVEKIPVPKSYKLVPVVGEDGNQLTLPTRVGQYVKYSNGCLTPITRLPLLWSEPGDLVFDLVEVTD